jgi:fatty acid-binding protein DegV
VLLETIKSLCKKKNITVTELERTHSSGVSYRIAVMHVGLPEEANKIARELKDKYPAHEIRVFEAGPVIATHVGPGAAGLAFHPWPL